MTKRRDFFKEFFSHLYVLTEEVKGHRHFKLPDLWKLDDAKFRQLKFRVREGVALNYTDQEIRCVKNEDETLLICARATALEKMFHLMQQRLTVGEIAEQLVQEVACEKDAIFQDVREFMLSLVKQAVCVPANDVYYEPENEQTVENSD